MKFRVKAGTHREGGKVYGPGDVIETHRNLAETFKNKFEPVDAEACVASLPEEKQPKPEIKGLKAVHMGFGKWDVVDEDGMAMNDAPLTKAEAKTIEDQSNSVPDGSMDDIIPPKCADEVETVADASDSDDEEEADEEKEVAKKTPRRRRRRSV